MKPAVKSVQVNISKWFEIKICFIAIAFQLCFAVCHYEVPRKTGD
jgi:hypothetical protein